MISIILSGGIGTRFWPLSTPENPKQFLPIFENNQSLFDLTLQRIQALNNEEIITVSNQKYQERLQHYGITPLYEPFGRNTFGAFILTLKYLYDQKKLDTPILFLPSDHMILNHQNFKNDIENGAKIVDEQNISLVLGITPEYPETGFGYIKASRVIEEKIALYGVKGFKEKPNLQLAKYYLNIGGYFWNCGIVITKGQILLEEIEERFPEIHAFILEKSYTDLIKQFDLIPNIPVEQAIIEKSRRVAMIKVSFDWSDLGSWESYFKYRKGNDSQHLVETNSTNNRVLTSKKTILIDVDDLTVIESEDGILIMKNNSHQKLKDALNNGE